MTSREGVFVSALVSWIVLIDGNVYVGASKHRQVGTHILAQLTIEVGGGTDRNMVIDLSILPQLNGNYPLMSKKQCVMNV
jgi:hypothetical protein